MSQVKLPKVPDQPGETAGKAEKASSGESGGKASGAARTSAVAAPEGTALRGILAAYESMDIGARGVAAEIAGVIGRSERRPSHVYVTSSDSELAGLADYRRFARSVDWLSAALRDLHEDIRTAVKSPPPRGGVRAMRRFIPGIPTTLAEIISDIIEPLAPTFTFSDTPITIESGAFAMLVAGAAAEHAEVVTPFSLALRQGTGRRYHALIDKLGRLEPEASQIEKLLESLPEEERKPFTAELTALREMITTLEKRLHEEPSIVRGVALHELLENGLIVHVSVFAAGTEQRTVNFLLGAWRRHAGGFAGAYSIYDGDGILRKGGFVRPMLDLR